MNKYSKKPERDRPTVKTLVDFVNLFDADPRDFIEECLFIKTKDQQTVPLKFNTAQYLIYKKIKQLKDQKKPIRMIILKARQEGVSTLCEGLIFERTARFENTNSLIVAHEPESTDAIFSMSKLFYDLLPFDVKPMRRYDNKKQIPERKEADRGNGHER